MFRHVRERIPNAALLIVGPPNVGGRFLKLLARME